MNPEMTVSEARAALPQIVQRVTDGEEVTITRHGKPVAVVVRPDTLRVRRAESAFAGAERIRAVLAEARTGDLDAGPWMTEERAEKMIAEIRADRDRS